MKKSFKIIFLIFINLLILASCETKEKNLKNDEPIINTSIVISNLSDEDFYSIGTNHVTKADFKKVIFIFDMKHNNKITDRNISIPNFKDIANSYDNIERYWFGDNTKIDNIGENYAYYETTFILYTGVLSQDEITNIFQSENVLVSYQENNKSKENIIKLENIIKYE